MIYGQLEIAETSETIEIAEQVVQKMTYGHPETVETYELLKLLKHMKLLVCILIFYHSPVLLSEVDPLLGQNTQANDSRSGSCYVLENRLFTLNWGYLSLYKR